MKKLFFLFSTILASLLFHLIWGFINLPGFKEVAILFDYPFSLVIASILVIMLKITAFSGINKKSFYITLILNLILAPLFVTYISIPTSLYYDELKSKKHYETVYNERNNLKGWIKSNLNLNVDEIHEYKEGSPLNLNNKYIVIGEIPAGNTKQLVFLLISEKSHYKLIDKISFEKTIDSNILELINKPIQSVKYLYLIQSHASIDIQTRVTTNDGEVYFIIYNLSKTNNPEKLKLQFVKVGQNNY